MSTAKYVPLRTHIARDQYERLQRLAARTRVPIDEYMRDAVAALLDAHEEAAPAKRLKQEPGQGTEFDEAPGDAVRDRASRR